MFCTECGEENGEDHQFCIHCGISMQIAVLVASPQETTTDLTSVKPEPEIVQKSMDRQKKIAIISVAAIVGLFIISFLLMDRDLKIIPTLLLLFFPLILGEFIFLYRPEKPVSWAEGFRGWVARKRAANFGRHGLVRRWFLRPLFFCLIQTMQWTQDIKDPYLRTGVRVSASLYVIGLITYIAVTIVFIVIAIIIFGFMLWCAGHVLGWNDGVPTRSRSSSVGRRKSKTLHDFGRKDTRIDKQGNVYDTSGIISQQVGRIDKEGRFYDTKGMISQQVGRIDEDGRIYDTKGMISQQVGRIDEEGNVYDTTGIISQKVGSVEKE